MDPNELILCANQIPGLASFANFDQAKEYLRIGLERYNNTAYSIENIEQARFDFEELKAVKKKLSDKCKELEKAYFMPIELVKAQFDELIKMVKEPYDIIDRMLKEHAQEEKRKEIMYYATNRASILENYSTQVITSPAFFNKRWLNSSYLRNKWMMDINGIITRAKNDILAITTLGGDRTNALLAFYFETLSFQGLENFANNLSEQSGAVGFQEVTAPEEIISKVVKLTGSKNKVEAYINSAALLGVQVVDNPMS